MRSVSESSGEARAEQAAASPRAAVRTGFALLLVLVAAIVAALAFSSTDVCDTGTTRTGQVVTTCRHLQVTDPPVLAGLLLVVLALAVLIDFNEIAFMGLSMKRNLADARAAAESAVRAQKGAQLAESKAAEAEANAGRAAVSAKDASLAAHGAMASAETTEELIRAQQTQVTAASPLPTGDLEEQIQALADKYVRVRASRDPGDRRTEEMTAVVAELIALFSANDADLKSNAATWLRSENPGTRLAAYAYLYSKPDIPLADPLAGAAIDEDKPFTQYWGLRALRRQVEAGQDLDRNRRRQLQRLLNEVGAGTDRGHEITAIRALSADGSGG